MDELRAVYDLTIYALGAAGALVLVQLLVADLAGIKARHVPGSAVVADHDNFLFRASRTVANTNESIAAFVLAALFGLFVGAAPAGLNAFAWLFVVARVAYMGCYYCDFRRFRSISFGVGFVAILGMLVSSTT